MDPKGGAPDLSSYISELARQSGRPAEDLLVQIGRWAAEAKESDDPRRLGLAAFAEKKFRLAARDSGKAAFAKKRRGAEDCAERADRGLEGDSSSNELDFANAVRVYRAGLEDLGVYGKGRDDLRLPTSPSSTTMRQASHSSWLRRKLILGSE